MTLLTALFGKQNLHYCPFIKLDGPFKENFKKHLNKHELKLLIVFGKNENELQRSLNKDDFEFFKSFPNVSIIHEPRLHAKYYGNEKKGVVTSINLYDYSVEHNIEFGVYSEQTLLTQFSSNNHDVDAWQKCIDIANNGKVVFIKRPVYENKKFLFISDKNYMYSDIMLDDTSYFYDKKNTNLTNKKLEDFPDELDSESYRPIREEKKEIKEPVREYNAPTNYQQKPTHGFCIRTGDQIAFNPQQPLSKPAWRIWNEYANPDFPEKYCHRTGQLSNGKTSFRNPILNH